MNKPNTVVLIVVVLTMILLVVLVILVVGALGAGYRGGSGLTPLPRDTGAVGGFLGCVQTAKGHRLSHAVIM